MATEGNEILESHINSDYKYGFTTDIEMDSAPKGLNEDIIRFISAKKNEPQWLLDYRLKAFRHWLTLDEPTWAHVHYPKIDFQNIIYYSAPKKSKQLNSLDEVDPELLKTFEKLGISLLEQKRLTGVAVDAVIDSVSVKTTFKEKLGELGIIFSSFSEAVHEHPELIKKYMGSVVPYTDNYYSALNSAVFLASLAASERTTSSLSAATLAATAASWATALVTPFRASVGMPACVRAMLVPTCPVAAWIPSGIISPNIDETAALP